MYQILYLCNNPVHFPLMTYSVTARFEQFLFKLHSFNFTPGYFRLIRKYIFKNILLLCNLLIISVYRLTMKNAADMNGLQKFNFCL